MYKLGKKLKIKNWIKKKRKSKINLNIKKIKIKGLDNVIVFFI